MGKLRSITLFSLTALLIAACGPSKAEIATSNAQTQAVKDGLATEEAGTQVVRQATEEAESTSAAATTTSEFMQAATATRAVELTATSVAQERAAQEAAFAAATASASSIYDQVLELAANGHLSKTEGQYFELPDFVESWAQIDWYQWYRTEYSPSDFVIRADTSWESASQTANWFSSGCGFVFRETGVENHYLAYLGLDGNVQFARSVNSVWRSLGYSYYGKVDVPQGEAEVMLVVEDDWIIFFVNGERVHSRQDGGLTSGDLGLTLLSGTNKDYGTRCTMKNIELWILD